MEIKIEISGPMAVGKTVLMHEIGRHLESLGFDVALKEGPQPGAPEMRPDTRDASLDRQRNNMTRVRINTRLS